MPSLMQANAALEAELQALRATLEQLQQEHKDLLRSHERKQLAIVEMTHNLESIRTQSALSERHMGVTAQLSLAEAQHAATIKQLEEKNNEFMAAMDSNGRLLGEQSDVVGRCKHRERELQQAHQQLQQAQQQLQQAEQHTINREMSTFNTLLSQAKEFFSGFLSLSFWQATSSF